MKTFLEMGIGGSFLILLVLMFRRFLSGCVPRRFIVCLWLCVMVRLLLPFSISVKWPPKLWPERPVETEQIFRENTAEASFFVYLNEGMTSERQPALSLPAKAGIKTLFPILGIIWLITSISLAAAVLIRHVRCLKRYRTSLPVNPGKMDGCEEWLGRHGLVRTMQIRVSDQVETPLTYGLFRPVILLPANLCLSGTDLASVLEHEWAHIKNRDILTKYLLYLTVCIYWFHPLVWLLASYLNRDIELACDEAVLENKGLHFRKGYALLLLRLADNRSTSWLTGACFVKNSEMEERICEIMKKKHYTWAAAILAAVVVICMIPAFISLSKKNTENRPGSLPAESQTIADNDMETEGMETSEEAGIAKVVEKLPEEQAVAEGSNDSRQMVNGADIVQMAKDHIGNPFQTFGSDLETGVDSSGFVKEIYKMAGIELPHSTEGLFIAGTEIAMDKIESGDLILYGKENEDHTIFLDHAAIYIGNNQVIHASNAKDGVKLAEMDYRPLEDAKAVRIIE